MTLLPAVTCCDALQPPLGHGYVRKGDQIHFEGGGFADENSGTRIDRPGSKDVQGFVGFLGHPVIVCESPNVETLLRLFEKHSRDRHRVYYKWISPGVFLVVELPKADAASFRALSTVFAADNNSVWYMDQPIKGSDPSSFVIVENLSSKDKKAVYVSDRPVRKLDPATFRFLATGYFADAKVVCWGTDPVPVADPDSFQILSDLDGV